MKRLFVAASLMFIVIASSAFTPAENIPSAVMLSFKNSFTNATQVVYAEVKDMVRVEFFNESAKQVAYYDHSGSLIVLVKAITPDLLPQSLQKDLQKRFAGYTVTDVQKFENSEQVEYYIFLDGSKKSMVLNSTSSRWRIYQINKK